ncbi:helix-turn-helix domain-containing protein [Paenarthrobacter sp. OM7]|uniref:AraC-like ligand-binding domain-containing protein n=1 Tax=Paenarthrobacter sp. OM7 TaxID=3041264 RepID=UPI002468421C|nr:helix-turn-helix domain-containing protein [Paenarthrobacter sp. OM7]WGM22431.1 helix-turn-helix domain-containing protein [Paenarthrobacter sp. OM7]
MAKVVSTAAVSPRNSVSFWTEAVSDTFVDLDCKAGDGRESIDGEITVQTLASLDLARVRASAQSVHRTPAAIDASTDDYYLVGIQTEGSCLVTQEGRSAALHDGGFALYDTTRPYSLLLTGHFEQLVLRLPRIALERHLPEAARLTALAVNADPGAARLLVNTVQFLANDIDVLPSDVSLSVSQGVEHLIVAGLGGLARCVPDAQRVSRRKLVQAHILENLGDESLSIKSIARELHLSPSSIHRAFAADGETVMGWVWQQRLNRIRETLLTGSYDGTLTDLSLSWGFSDPAHFSRAFRQRYGHAPSQLLRPIAESPFTPPSTQ